MAILAQNVLFGIGGTIFIYEHASTILISQHDIFTVTAKC
jgi:hypothetical protein